MDFFESISTFEQSLNRRKEDRRKFEDIEYFFNAGKEKRKNIQDRRYGNALGTMEKMFLRNTI